MNKATAPPLIVAVHIPAHSLDEDLVLVESEKGAESERIHEGKDDRGGGTVALEYLEEIYWNRSKEKD